MDPYARICADRTLLDELNLRPLAIDAVRRSHEPYHFSIDEDVMDLMNLPYGMVGDRARHFIIGALRTIVRDIVPDAVERLDPNHNTITFYSPKLGPSGCTWRYQLPWRDGEPVQIRRVPC